MRKVTGCSTLLRVKYGANLGFDSFPRADMALRISDLAICAIGSGEQRERWSIITQVTSSADSSGKQFFIQDSKNSVTDGLAVCRKAKCLPDGVHKFILSRS